MSLREVMNRGIQRVLLEALGLYTVTWITATSWNPPGTNIYDRDWDALIILDACRVDALREVAPEYDFIDSVDSVMSIAGTSKEWVDHTFTTSYEDAVNDTAYVTANSFAEQLANDSRDYLKYLESEETLAYRSGLLSPLVHDNKLSAENFDTFTPLFSQFVGDPVDQLHPQVVTDVAIQTAKETDANRLLIHYMQPHKPYIYPTSSDDEMEEYHRRPFEYLRQTGSREMVWEAYLNNLRFVLDHVDILLDNIDAERVVLTADHGEMFGEWGLTGHKAGVLHPALRWVPWVVTSAEDTGEYEPDEHLEGHEATEEEIRERLKVLGYK